MGMEEEKAQNIATANTAREALSIIKEEVQRDRIINYVMEKAISSARGFAGPGPDITYYLFDFGGDLLIVLHSSGNPGG